MNDIHPALSPHVENMEQYDVILLGYPTWWATMPMPVYSFLEEYDFSGKTIISFSSHGGTMFGDSVSTFQKWFRELMWVSVLSLIIPAAADFLMKYRSGLRQAGFGNNSHEKVYKDIY